MCTDWWREWKAEQEKDFFNSFHLMMSRANICIILLFYKSLRNVVSHAERWEASARKNEWERDNQSLPTGCISKAARLKGTRGCMRSGAAISLGDESSSKPDTGSCRRRIAVLSPLKTKHTHTHSYIHKHTPADDHGSDDWLPSGVEQGAAGWVLGGNDDPQRSQTHEERANQGRHIRVGIWGRRRDAIFPASFFLFVWQFGTYPSMH